MRNLIISAVLAATITGLFVGALAIAIARAETKTYPVSSNAYLPIQTLEATY
jgi:hypothetical protein